MSKAMEKAARVEEASAPELEERPWPALGARMYHEVLARCQRDLNEAIEMIAAEMGITPAEGWQADAHRARFIRQVSPEASD